VKQHLSEINKHS